MIINDVIRNALYYLDVFLKRPLWAILPALMAFLVGVAIVYTLPRTYESEALLMIEAPRSQTSLVPSTVATEHFQFVEQRVLAREKLLALAEKFDLFPDIRQTLSSTRLGQLVRQHISIQTVAVEASERYAGTSAMRVGFKYATAAQTAMVASELVNMIIDENRRLRIHRASDVSNFLAREVTDLRARMQASERDWHDFVKSNADALPSHVDGLQSEMQDKDRELVGLDQSISAVEQELGLLEAELRLGEQRPEATVRDRTQLAELERELASKLLTYSTAHPEIRALAMRVEALKQNIAQSALQPPSSAVERSPELALVAERIAFAKARQASFAAKRGDITKQIGFLRATIARAPTVEAQLGVIERERESLQRALDDMTSRLATARTGERLEIDETKSNVQVIERPETPLFPSAPTRRTMLLVVLAASLASAVAGLYLGDAIQPAIRGAFDLKQALAGSTLVMIPRWTVEPMPQSHTGNGGISRMLPTSNAATS